MTSNKGMTDPNTKQARRRKVAAVLAGGLVLGVGTMATLASWNDSEFAKATFTAGTFNMEGSVDQTAFTEHSTVAAPNTLSFTNTFANMQPGDTIYAPYALHLDKDTTYNATVAVTQTFMGASTGLTYTLFTTETAGCSAASIPVTNVVLNNTAINSVGTPSTFNLAKTTSLGSAAGATTYLCFKVTADNNLVQKQVTTPTWNFTATSGVS